MEISLSAEGVSTYLEQMILLLSFIIFTRIQLEESRLTVAAIASLFKYQILTRVLIPPSVWGWIKWKMNKSAKPYKIHRKPHVPLAENLKAMYRKR